ncbi:ATP-dependent helicase HrpB [Paenibacillus albiflavus]|uniref:ATP-dependent helicase HrpB n=2 Tax=Paenibacillus albiflavus TaxID=2545760 RepID=A0A4R4E6T5_9BACL|nr:ATP-dependent helicase HrpB [Paenibacillus albiflavus]
MGGGALPVDEILDHLKETLHAHQNAVLAAPPGAGKTTRIPLAIMNEPWLGGKRILMLEPRRLAARTAARYMAAAIGEQVGQTVGYRVKQDTRVSAKTRIEVITEGVLTRMLQADPSLEDVGIVILDEFHERSLHADLGLALCLQSQAVLREDLRLLIMSATLDMTAIAALLHDAPIIQSEGRAFPVETRYLPSPVEGRMEAAVVRVIREAMAAEEGDMLVFLPGIAEIRRVQVLFSERPFEEAVRIAPLHSSLSQEAQDAAISPAKQGERKIVLTTSIAETSLTVQGVRIVVDSGLMRVSSFSPRTGMSRLETVRVTQASADQRQGRAGRTEAGVCYRLWTEQENRQLAPHTTPEIREADLTALALELAAWGVHDPAELQWLDLPPKAAYTQACALLRELGALHANGAITPHGRRMAELALHPRLGHMLLKAASLGLGALACELAALLSERSFLRGDASAEVDLRLRVEALRRSSGAAVSGSRDYAVAQRIAAEASQLQRMLGIAEPDDRDHHDLSACGLLLALAYPDRIAQLRTTGRFLLSSGRGAMIAQLQPLSNAPYLVAAELDDQGADSRIYLAAPCDLTDLMQLAEDGLAVCDQEMITWDDISQAVRTRKQLRLGALVLKDGPLADPDPESILHALIEGITHLGLQTLPWSKAASQLRRRIQFMHQLEPELWPDMSDQALLDSAIDWLGPHLYGIRSIQELKSVQMSAILESMLSWEQKRELDEFAPTHLVVPSGSRIPIDYSDVSAPVLAVRLQEMFGLERTPTIGRGRIPLTIHLLSPAHRPVQVTQDLTSFWTNTYYEVRKDLKGRYPKHYWPDNPLEAIPTSRVRPKT